MKKRPGLKKTKASPEGEHKKLKAYAIKFTVDELVHLRDLFSILLPPDASRTLSQSLAQSEHRTMIEAKLWSKLNKLFADAGIPLGDEAPDFAVAPDAPPSLGVYQLNMRPTEENHGEEE
jgi:hypothetical protein